MFWVAVIVLLVSCVHCLPAKTVRVGVEPGGSVAVSTDDIDVKKAADFAIYDLNEISNCLYKYKIVSIDQAEFKVVEGDEYRLNMTTCMYNPQDKESTDPCSKIHPPIIQRCAVVVLEQPWMDPPSLMTGFKCSGCGP